MWSNYLHMMFPMVSSHPGRGRPPRGRAFSECESRAETIAPAPGLWKWMVFFPTCQVRVVRFYVSCLLLLSSHLLSSSCLTVTLNHSGLFRTSTTTILLSVPCRTSTTTITASVPCRTSTTTITASVPCRTSTAGIPAQCSLPDLNHDQTTTIPAQCSLPDLKHDHPRPVFPAGPQPRVSPPSVPCRTSTTTIHAQCSLPDLNREYPRQKICHIECQKICQIEC